MPEPVFLNDLLVVTQYLRDDLENKKCILLYAHNRVGKTRLSTEFKNLGKDAEDEQKRDTLYFNAFTEDLFTWDNDLKGDREHALKINVDSKFFAGLRELEMDTRIRPLPGSSGQRLCAPQHRRHAFLPSRGCTDRTLRSGAQRKALLASFQHAPLDHGKNGQLSRPRTLLRLHQTTRRRYRRFPAHPNRKPSEPWQLLAI